MKKNYFEMTDEELEKAVNEEMKDIPHGAYHVGIDEWQILTGKQGWINFNIALIKAVRDGET